MLRRLVPSLLLALPLFWGDGAGGGEGEPLSEAGDGVWAIITRIYWWVARNSYEVVVGRGGTSTGTDTGGGGSGGTDTGGNGSGSGR